MDGEQNPRVTVESSRGRTVRTTVWDSGTWDERVTVDLRQRCPGCGTTWWTEEDPRKPVEVVCGACRDREKELARLEAEEEAKRLRRRQRIALIPVGCFVAGCVIAAVAGLVSRLFGGK